MNYHNILHDDIRNGSGLRVTLFISGCNHYCNNCQNPQTWDSNSGIEFDSNAKEEIFEQLSKDYIDGITFSGGDPLYKTNVEEVFSLIQEIQKRFPTKTIWLYTGYEFEDIFDITDEVSKSDDKIFENQIRRAIVLNCDVVVDGKFVDDLKDVKYHWAGSTNQRVIDVYKTINNNMNVVLYKENLM